MILGQDFLTGLGVPKIWVFKRREKIQIICQTLQLHPLVFYYVQTRVDFFFWINPADTYILHDTHLLEW
jgi:hypothetical protein